MQGAVLCEQVSTTANGVIAVGIVARRSCDHAGTRFKARIGEKTLGPRGRGRSARTSRARRNCTLQCSLRSTITGSGVVGVRFSCPARASPWRLERSRQAPARGVNDDGACANFVEIEQILYSEHGGRRCTCRCAGASGPSSGMAPPLSLLHISPPLSPLGAIAYGLQLRAASSVHFAVVYSACTLKVNGTLPR
eukprot:6091218-Pleurochrysis_carterae.AAC.1